MRGKDLLDKMELVDGRYVEEADTAQEQNTKDADVKKRYRRRYWLSLAAAAAVICLAVGGYMWSEDLRIQPQPGPDVTQQTGGDKMYASMIGFFIYRGKEYVHYSNYYNYYIDPNVVDEYLGTVVHSIDEWSRPEAYVELSGSVKGDFYSIKGYDPSFMLGMIEPSGSVTLYICNEPGELNTGEDIYEKQLHLSEHYNALHFETHDSWDKERGEMYALTDEDAVEKLLAALNAAAIQNAGEVREEHLQKGEQLKEQYHLYFLTNNGIPVHIRLSEGGYVRYQGLLDLCVQLPDSVYQLLLEALKNSKEPVQLERLTETLLMLRKCQEDSQLGPYISSYTPENAECFLAEIFSYDIGQETGEKSRTKKIHLEYSDPENPDYHYALTITWRDEDSINSRGVPMLEPSQLTVDKLSEYVTTHWENGETYPFGSKINVGVRDDKVSVVLWGTAIDVSTAWKILDSIDW